MKRRRGNATTPRGTVIWWSMVLPKTQRMGRRRSQFDSASLAVLNPGVAIACDEHCEIPER